MAEIGRLSEIGANAGEGGCLSSVTHPSRLLWQEFIPPNHTSIRSVEKIPGQGLGSFQDGRQRVDLTHRMLGAHN